MKETELHMIGNTHLDPVWFWNWQEGYQEAKAIFRSALDRMQEDPDFIFTCGTTICYEWFEKTTLPCGEAFARQSLYGRQYFLSKFGKAAKTGYNVDNFGHCAAFTVCTPMRAREPLRGLSRICRF